MVHFNIWLNFPVAFQYPAFHLILVLPSQIISFFSFIYLNNHCIVDIHFSKLELGIHRKTKCLWHTLNIVFCFRNLLQILHCKSCIHFWFYLKVNIWFNRNRLLLHIIRYHILHMLCSYTLQDQIDYKFCFYKNIIHDNFL